MRLVAARARGLGGPLLGSGAGAMGAVAVIFGLTSSAFWYDSARVGQRDQNLARAIYSRVAALPGFDGKTFRVIGGTDYPDLSWGSLASWTTFHAGNPRLGIFREMYGLAEDTYSLPVSPRACHAFPAADAAFVQDGIAYVCLDDFPPLTDALHCVPLTAEAGAEICLGGGVVAHSAPVCLPTGKSDPDMRVAFRFQGQSHAPEPSFSTESFPIPMHGRCYTVALAPGPGDLEEISVTLYSPDDTVLWEQPIPGARIGADQ